MVAMSMGLKLRLLALCFLSMVGLVWIYSGIVGSDGGKHAFSTTMGTIVSSTILMLEGLQIQVQQQRIDLGIDTSMAFLIVRTGIAPKSPSLPFADYKDMFAMGILPEGGQEVIMVFNDRTLQLREAKLKARYRRIDSRPGSLRVPRFHMMLNVTLPVMLSFTQLTPKLEMGGKGIDSGNKNMKVRPMEAVLWEFLRRALQMGSMFWG